MNIDLSKIMSIKDKILLLLKRLENCPSFDSRNATFLYSSVYCQWLRPFIKWKIYDSINAPKELFPGKLFNNLMDNNSNSLCLYNWNKALLQLYFQPFPIYLSIRKRYQYNQVNIDQGQKGQELQPPASIWILAINAMLIIRFSLLLMI